MTRDGNETRLHKAHDTLARLIPAYVVARNINCISAGNAIGTVKDDIATVYVSKAGYENAFPPSEQGLLKIMGIEVQNSGGKRDHNVYPTRTVLTERNQKVRVMYAPTQFGEEPVLDMYRGPFNLL